MFISPALGIYVFFPSSTVTIPRSYSNVRTSLYCYLFFLFLFLFPKAMQLAELTKFRAQLQQSVSIAASVGYSPRLSLSLSAWDILIPVMDRSLTLGSPSANSKKIRPLSVSSFSRRSHCLFYVSSSFFVFSNLWPINKGTKKKSTIVTGFNLEMCNL